MEDKAMKGIKDNSYGLGFRNPKKIGVTYWDKEGVLWNQLFRWMLVVEVLQRHHIGGFQKGTKAIRRQSKKVLQDETLGNFSLQAPFAHNKPTDSLDTRGFSMLTR